MPNDFFSFKQFTVWQSKCAMKVGTDGTLLGAWAKGGMRILDIGTGTGLISLMMAQRFPMAQITGIDIDIDATRQASENVAASPFSDRIRIIHADVREFVSKEKFDCIVSNPPYFEKSLESPDFQRTLARHNGTLSYTALFQSAKRLLTNDGLFSLIVPFDYKERVLAAATASLFFLHNECVIKTTPRKSPRRVLLAFGTEEKNADVETAILEEVPGLRSDWYRLLTSDFYL